MNSRIGVPTQGAQLLQKEGGGWRVHLLDDVGRGYPRMIAVVPVLVQEQTLKLAQGSLELSQPDPANEPSAVNWHLHRNKNKNKNKNQNQNQNQHSGSYEFEMPAQGDCPLGGDQWLALMVFNQGDVPPIGQVAEDLTAAIGDANFDDWRSGMLPAAPAPAAASRGPSAAQPIRFVLCSCQYPHDVIDRMPQAALASPQLHGPADASMLALAHLLEPEPNRPALLIQAGDQVYVDATAGLFDPMVLRDRFRRPYQLLRISQGSIELQRRLPTAVERLIDDHEISDNWEPGDADPPGSGEPLKSGVAAYWELQRLQREPSGQTIWRHRKISGLAFFFTDTRTGRQARLARNWRECLIMDETQEQALSSWLDGHAGPDKPPCFIASPSMLLPRPLALRTDDAAALHCDGWAGYPRSLHHLLAGLCKRKANNVVFLSGDEHLSALATIDIRCNSEDWHARTHSIHSSAMYAPYPFANAREADFAEQEKFTFSPDDEAGRTYTCHVSTKFPRTGDGFAVVQCAPTASGWTTTVDFHRNRGGPAVHLPLR